MKKEIRTVAQLAKGETAQVIKVRGSYIRILNGELSRTRTNTQALIFDTFKSLCAFVETASIDDRNAATLKGCVSVEITRN